MISVVPRSPWMPRRCWKRKRRIQGSSTRRRVSYKWFLRAKIWSKETTVHCTRPKTLLKVEPIHIWKSDLSKWLGECVFHDIGRMQSFVSESYMVLVIFTYSFSSILYRDIRRDDPKWTSILTIPFCFGKWQVRLVVSHSGVYIKMQIFGII